jgi:hypothetical protein
MWLPVFAVLVGVGPLTWGAAADEVPQPPAGEIRLGSGRVVAYTVHFDRNSLRGSIHLGDRLIGLTTSGALVCFELPAVRWVRERVGVGEVACLGRGEGGTVLAGLADGRVCRLDPATLELTDVARLPTAPTWLGWAGAIGPRPAGIVAVAEQSKPMEKDGERWDQPYSVVHDLASGKTVALEETASAFLIDRAGQFWLGADRGEFGGRIIRVDLASGTASELRPPPDRQPDSEALWQGVYGFIALGDGPVWAFGGTSHMGSNSAYITRIDGAEPRRLFAFESPELGKEPDRGRPCWPITHVIEEPSGLLVLAYSDVFRADKALKSWNKTATLAIRYRWGRPNAVGSYPSVTAVHPPARAGEPYVLATVADGYLLLADGTLTPRSLVHQLGASGVERVANTAEGTLFLEGNEAFPAWKLGAKGWHVESITPPFETDPANDALVLEQDSAGWYETRVLVAPDGAIWTVSGTNVSTGTRTTGRRIDRKTVRIGRETSSLSPRSSFITRSGTLWNTSDRNLKRFQDGQWQTVARLPRKARWVELDTLRWDGPPWLLLDRRDHTLWRLEHDAGGENPRIDGLEVREDGKALEVHDAIAWSAGTLLLATSAGLRTYLPGTRTLSRSDLAEPAQPASVLVRDGLDRLWLGGTSGLWLVEPGQKAAEPVDQIPGVGRSEVSALALDPDHADGVIAAFGARGVAFLRAGPRQ